MIGRIRNTHLRRLVLVIATPLVAASMLAFAIVGGMLVGISHAAKFAGTVISVGASDIPLRVSAAWRGDRD